MKFLPLPLAGAYVIEPEPRRDERGFFARVFCAETFRKHGLVDRFVQTNN
jgi:dTDP-4-dehydrorhamnose 3,5-epimerase